MSKISWHNILERFTKRYGDWYDYSLSEATYETNRSKINIICPLHGLFQLAVCKHQGGRECRSCYFWKKYRSILIAKHGNKFDYTLAAKVFQTCESVIPIICPIHGEFQQRASNHANGHGCPVCANRIPLTQDQWIARFNEIHDSFYDYSEMDDTQKICKSIIRIICPEHGPFMQKIAYHIGGCKCPKCKLSKGALAIVKFLDQNKIPYIDQHKFEDLTGINDGLLRFDFYLPETNILIEYDGQQHFRAMGVFGGEEIFERVCIHDQLKTQYALDNKIPLIRIPYWDFKNIDEILTRELLTTS